MKDEQRNVFISHVHENDNRLRPLKDLLKKEGLGIRDYSVNNEKPNKAKSEDYIWRKHIKPRLDASGTLAVLISPEMTKKDSQWVQREIEYAHEKDKRIVGIWNEGESGELPHELADYADAIVDWNGDRIKQAILEEEEVFCDEEGEPLSPRELDRHKC